MDGMVAQVATLDQCQIFFDSRQRLVYCYNRTDELVYEFYADISQALTQQYDTAFEKFGKGGQSVMSWGKKRT